MGPPRVRLTGLAIPETGLVLMDAVYVLAWNTNFVKAADAPRRISDLTDPK